MTLFGRHALLAFTIHIYLAKILDVVNVTADMPNWVNWGLVLLSVFLMKVLVEAYEKNLARTVRPVWVNTVHALFK